jgi:hypothetical protein
LTSDKGDGITKEGQPASGHDDKEEQMHFSGTFVYQPQTIIPGRDTTLPDEYYPAAITVGVMVLNDDGTAMFGVDADSPNILAEVVISRPFLQPGDAGFSLEWTNINNEGYGYTELTSVLSEELVDALPSGWMPMALVVLVNNQPGGIITAAPAPAPDLGITYAQPISTTGPAKP